MSLLAGHRLAVIDVETTGWSPSEGHSMIEVGRVTLEDGRIADEWSALIGPRRPIPPDAVRVHGITEAMLEGAPDPRDVARALSASCRDVTLVFHNAAFDLSFCRPLLAAAGEPPLHNPVVDTLGLARGLFGAGENALGELAARLGLPDERRHRALGDARTTARVLLALAPRWEAERGIRSLAELAAASQDALRPAPRRPAPAVLVG
jgi:DNA polymerase III epsilon subunit family exonuclease